MTGNLGKLGCTLDQGVGLETAGITRLGTILACLKENNLLMLGQL